VDDGEWNADPGKPPRRRIEHIKCPDVGSIDDEQAANAQAYIKQNANGPQP
jgi:hypothetical protein